MPPASLRLRPLLASCARPLATAREASAAVARAAACRRLHATRRLTPQRQPPPALPLRPNYALSIGAVGAEVHYPQEAAELGRSRSASPPPPLIPRRPRIRLPMSCRFGRSSPRPSLLSGDDGALDLEPSLQQQQQPAVSRKIIASRAAGRAPPWQSTRYLRQGERRHKFGYALSSNAKCLLHLPAPLEDVFYL